MIPVAEAQVLCLAGLDSLPAETLPLAEASGRWLAEPLAAARAQPPFDTSAMDGYAVAAHTVATGDAFEVVGESAAGHGWSGQLGQGQALRIFTGAPVPPGASRVVLQEDVSRDGATALITGTPSDNTNIRPAGADFPKGFALAPARRLGPPELALIAAMNIGEVAVHRAPVVSLLATGDELIMPGGAPRPDQIVASNIYALKAMIEAEGARARILPIAPDTEAGLAQSFALTAGSDVVVTIGGASVGDHDLVGQAAADWGVERQFHKIAMRPGKPLMRGRIGQRPFLGLPGNPVSAIVCGALFLMPVVRRLMGAPDPLPKSHRARLAVDLPPNGPRAHYMRARIEHRDDGPWAIPFDRQDSSLLTVLSDADALIALPALAPATEKGTYVNILQL